MSVDDPLVMIGSKLPRSKKLAFEQLLRRRGSTISIFMRQKIYEELEREQAADQLSLNLDTKK